MTAPAPLDRADMLGAVRSLPDQIDRMWRALADLQLPWPPGAFDAVAVIGMGGSAIGGDLAAGLLADRLTVPVINVRDAHVPAWIGPRTLAVVASFSGNTAETLAAWDAAAARGAPRLALTSGGRLATLAEMAAVPLVDLPPGGSPRAALGYGLAGVMRVLGAIGVVDAEALAPDVAAATAHMRALIAADAAADGAADDGPSGLASPAASVAASLAGRIDGRIPMVITSASMAAVGRRWKAQLNENAKVTALSDCVPELHHNTVVGFGGPSGLADAVHVLMLSTAGDDRWHRVTAELLTDTGIPFTRVDAPPGGPLAQGLWLTQLGDLVSVRLAYRRGVDPTPITAIDRLKAALVRLDGTHEAND